MVFADDVTSEEEVAASPVSGNNGMQSTSPSALPRVAEEGEEDGEVEDDGTIGKTAGNKQKENEQDKAAAMAAVGR